MYEITIAATVFVVFHTAIVYICGYVLRLPYAQFVAAMIGTGAVVSVLLKVAAISWRPRLQAAMAAESHDGELATDAGAALLVILVGGFVSSTMLYKRYGLSGWLGLFGANLIANMVI